MAKVVLYPNFAAKVWNLPKVRAALKTQATGIASRAKGIAAAEEVEAEVGTEIGTRPKGRPYARVTSDNADAEFGTSKTARRRVLGRASNITGA